MSDLPPLLSTLHGTTASPPPIWLMRQAGRHLPEYRRVREQAGGFLDLVLTPKLAAEVTLQPVRRYRLDGAILFSDILMVPWALGQGLDFRQGEGPRLGALPAHLVEKTFDLTKLSPISQTLSSVRQSLAGTAVTILGFVGAPWTVATYMIEGGKPTFCKSLAFLQDTAKAFVLFRTLIQATIAYAKMQIAAGAQVIKIFDSWAGKLPPSALRRWSFDPMVDIAAALSPTPVIYFPRGVGAALSDLYQQVRARTQGPFALALGEEQDLQRIREKLDPSVCLQGNLAPTALLGPIREQERQVARLLSLVRGTPHIFNLGHGVDKHTDPARVQALVDQVRAG